MTRLTPEQIGRRTLAITGDGGHITYVEQIYIDDRWINIPVVYTTTYDIVLSKE